MLTLLGLKNMDGTTLDGNFGISTQIESLDGLCQRYAFGKLFHLSGACNLGVGTEAFNICLPWPLATALE